VVTRPTVPEVVLPSWWAELAVLATGYVVYQVVQVMVTGSRASAVARTKDIWAVERSVHLDPELWLNHVVAGNHLLVLLTGFYYGILHFVVTPAVLVWSRLRRAGRYARLRNALILASLVALVVYWLLPVAPPRLALTGIVDTLRAGDVLSAAQPYGPAALADQYAAMPSLHVAWAVWVALALVVAFPASRWRHLAWLYPLGTVLVVLGTGNHLLADTVAGALLVWAAWYLTTHFPGSAAGTAIRPVPYDLAPASAPVSAPSGRSAGSDGPLLAQEGGLA
jgi:hypothetical protein